MVGLHHYGVPLKDMAKIMGKKFACGSAVADDDKHGECIQLQGDISLRFMDFAEAELSKYNIPPERIKFEEVKKKKKGTAADGGAGEEEEDD